MVLSVGEHSDEKRFRFGHLLHLRKAPKRVGQRHEVSPPQILASGSWRCCASSAAATRIGARLSNPAGAFDRRLSRWQFV